MFFDKFAKLKSDVNTSGYGFKVVVYDDEVSMEKPVMWLDARLTDIDGFIEHYMESTGMFDLDDESGFAEIDYEEIDFKDVASNIGFEFLYKFKKVVMIDIVNIDNNLYFNLPQNRQQTCATSLFKRFIKYYRENYNNELVYADFENYDLQEKFKIACEKGIFPKESLKIIGETTYEQHSQDSQFNINNREKLFNVMSDMSTQLQDVGVNTEIDQFKIFMEANNISTIINAVETVSNSVTEKYDKETLDSLLNSNYSPNFLYGIIKNDGNVSFTFPLANSLFSKANCTYDISIAEFDIEYYESGTYLQDLVKRNGEKFQQFFDVPLTIKTKNGSFSVDEFFSQQEQIASKIKRLIRKG